MRPKSLLLAVVVATLPFGAARAGPACTARCQHWMSLIHPRAGTGRPAAAATTPEPPQAVAAPNPETPSPTPLSERRKRNARRNARLAAPTDDAKGPAQAVASPSTDPRVRSRATGDPSASPAPPDEAPKRIHSRQAEKPPPAPAAVPAPVPLSTESSTITLPPNAAIRSDGDAAALIFNPRDSDSIIARSRREQRRTVPGALRPSGPGSDQAL